MSELVPCKVVTLEPSRAKVSVPPDAVTLPSLAKLLLDEVVNLSNALTVSFVTMLAEPCIILMLLVVLNAFS